MSFDYDVTIVGAGPIGSTLAYELTKEDIKVCLIDKKKVIGLPLQCSGIINKRVLDFNQIPKELILNKVKSAFLHSKNHSFAVSKEEDQALIIDRVGLDQFLYNRAIENGVDSYLSSKVLTIDDIEGKVLFQNDSEEKTIKSKIIVGADGPLSLVSSTIGNDFNYYCASQYLVKVDKIKDMSFVDLFAYENLFPGFIWIIPVYKNIFRVGLFSNYDYKKQREILNDFLENDFQYGNFEVIEKYKGKIPIYNKDNKLYKNRALIIGDAASQVKPTTGGGLLIGFETVKIAKKNIIKALNLDMAENDLDMLANLFKDYQKDFEKRFLNEISYQFKVQKTLSTLSDDDLDYFFMKLKEKEADKLISEYGDMDNQSTLVKEFLKRGLILSLLPKIHKKELAKIWLL
ncbi:geranylgeranyl reductase family protein [Methanobrevibacter olleyae]|uniref:Geranylgeranyl reductase family protein n=1 Tax=Methanobrevibacter olleyae TaxID=294671 RepID=A0A126QZE3_METOL|nr:NAD(P)/FAD-dependent oxidoreductase [Methanobrevibacter olleyae]AMK15500.1 geranylgeranyl reductase family protein [Methanobrevibacter olleyae]